MTVGPRIFFLSLNNSLRTSGAQLKLDIVALSGDLAGREEADATEYEEEEQKYIPKHNFVVFV